MHVNSKQFDNTCFAILFFLCRLDIDIDITLFNKNVTIYLNLIQVFIHTDGKI